MITCPQNIVIPWYISIRKEHVGWIPDSLIFDISCMPLLFGEGLMVLHVDEKACQLFIIPMIVALSVHYQNLEEECWQAQTASVQMHCLSSINLPPVLAYRLFLTDAHIHSSRLQSLTHTLKHHNL